MSEIYGDNNVWMAEIQAGNDICQWITDHGGPTNITSQAIIQDLGSSYLTQQPVSGYTFTVTSQMLLGIGAYWLGNIPLGNQYTGCNFT